MKDESAALEKPAPANKRLLEGLIVVAALFFTAVLLYGPRWLSGEYIFNGVVQEQYYLIGQYAFDKKIIEDLSSGHFPLWNQYNALGTPLLGNMLSAVFYPLKPLVYVWDSFAARDLYILLRLLLAGLFTFALARRLRLSAPAALCAAVAFTFTGYFKMFINENYLNADVLLPGLVFFTLRLRDRPRLFDFVLLFVLMAAVFLNGHPEAAFYTLLFPAFLVIAASGDGRRFFRTSLMFAGAAVFALVLALPMLLPFFEYFSRGYHFHVPHTGFFHYPASQLASVFSPWFFGQAPPGAPFLTSPGFTWPDHAAGIPAYATTAVPWLFPALGTVTVLLVVIGAGRLRSYGRTELAMALYAVFFTGVMFGIPLFRLLGLLPVFSFSGNFKHPLPAVALVAAMFAGKGLDAAKEHIPTSRLIIITIYTALFVLLLGWVTTTFPGAPSYMNPQSGAALVLLIIAGAGAVMVSVKKTGKQVGKNRLRFAGYLLIIASLSLSLALDGYQQPMKTPGYLEKVQESEAIKKIREEGGLERLYASQETVPPNLFMLTKLPDIRVMDGINDRRLVKAVNTINGHTRTEGGRYWYRTVGYLQPRPEKIGHPLMKLFNVRYALMPGPLPYNTSIDRVMEESRILSPGPGHAGKTRLSADEAGAPALLQHPPARINLPITKAPGIKLKLKPAVSKSAAPRQEDGVWMAAAVSDSLAYARYLHPANKSADGNVAGVKVPVLCYPGRECVLELYTLPCASTDFDQAGWSDFRLGAPEDFNQGNWELVYRKNEWLYRSPQAQPRVFMAGKAKTVKEPEALKNLAGGDFAFSSKVLISGAEIPEVNESSGSFTVAGQLNSLHYSSQKIVIEAEMFEPGWLVLSDLYYPGWRCKAGGEEVRIYRTDYLLRGVRLKKGLHNIEFVYEPASFRIGLWAAIAAIAGMALLAFKGSVGSVLSRLK